MFIIGIPILVRQYLYIETAPCFCITCVCMVPPSLDLGKRLTEGQDVLTWNFTIRYISSLKIIEIKIRINFCTCHDSSAVMACAKFHSDSVTWMYAISNWYLEWKLGCLESVVKRSLLWRLPAMSAAWEDKALKNKQTKINKNPQKQQHSRMIPNWIFIYLSKIGFDFYNLYIFMNMIKGFDFIIFIFLWIW